MLIHPSQRYRLYIDETGIQSIKAANDRYLCLMGIIMRGDVHDKVATPRLRQIKEDIFGHTDDTPVILHRRELSRGEPPFDRLRKDDALSKEFEARWLSLLREIQYLAMAAAIDKKAHVERYKVWQHDGDAHEISAGCRPVARRSFQNEVQTGLDQRQHKILKAGVQQQVLQRIQESPV
jgi:hypothetical protein